MAVTAVFQKATPYKLVYFINSDVAGGSVTITSSGAATPDLATDVAGINGPIKRLGRAGLDGLGLVPAGGFNLQSETDALFVNLDPGNVLGNDNIPRATMFCQGMATDNDWIVRTSNAGGLPLILVTHPAAIASAWLVISVSHSIQR